jgi:hypothetical protein
MRVVGLASNSPTRPDGPVTRSPPRPEARLFTMAAAACLPVAPAPRLDHYGAAGSQPAPLPRHQRSHPTGHRRHHTHWLPDDQTACWLTARNLAVDAALFRHSTWRIDGPDLFAGIPKGLAMLLSRYRQSPPGGPPPPCCPLSAFTRSSGSVAPDFERLAAASGHVLSQRAPLTRPIGWAFAD